MAAASNQSQKDDGTTRASTNASTRVKFNSNASSSANLGVSVSTSSNASPSANPNTSASANIILTTALELFSQKGYDATSVDDIRLAAGFKSKASLYTHFKSKEEVATALLTAILTEEERLMLVAWQGAEADPLVKLLTMGRVFVEWGLTHPQEYAFCFLRVQQEAILQGASDRLVQTAPSYGLMLELIGQMREKYRVRPIGDEALLSMVIGLINKAVIDQGVFGPVPLAHKVAQIIEMCQGVLLTGAP